MRWKKKLFLKLIFSTCSTKPEGQVHEHEVQPASLFKGNHQVLIVKYLSRSNTEEICKTFIQQSKKNVCPNGHKLLECLKSIICLGGYIPLLLILYVIPEIKCKTVSDSFRSLFPNGCTFPQCPTEVRLGERSNTLYYIFVLSALLCWKQKSISQGLSTTSSQLERLKILLFQ